MEKKIKAVMKTTAKKKKTLVTSVLVLIGLLLIGGYELEKLKPQASQDILSLTTAKTIATDFINGSLMQQGTKADIENVTKENGLFKIKLKVGSGDKKQEVNSYLTLDGKKFFLSAPLDIEETKAKIAEERKKEATPEKITQTDKPKVDLYVMAFCPFGNKAEDTLKPVYDLLKNKVDFNFHYIVKVKDNKVQSLHGEKEVAQDEREACVLQDYGKNYWMKFATYVNSNCGRDGSCWEKGARVLGMSTAKIKSCVNTQGLKLMQANEKASTAVGASGSPTMIINGANTKTVYQYSNSEAYKKVICSAFKKAPKECEKTLATKTTTTQGGSCN
jgi:glutaredoxin